MQIGAFDLFIFHSKSASIYRNVRKIKHVTNVFSTTNPHIHKQQAEEEQQHFMHFQIRKQAKLAGIRSQLYEKLGCRATAHFAQNSNVYTNQTTN